MKVIVGIDIGGTKCAVSFARPVDGGIEILEKESAPTKLEFDRAMEGFLQTIRKGLETHPDWEPASIGISCGGPLDSRSGRILSPPNLKSWDNADCFTPLREAFRIPVALQNDADACALAEWKWGAGRGTENMIFLTFGTGMGAGLILGGQLYIGSNNLAGEVGHVRLAQDGPDGYGKKGSFEGFCSGGGIARMGKLEAIRAINAGSPPMFCPTMDDVDDITAKSIAQALEQGDPLAKKIYSSVGRRLGQGIAMLIDILNPEVVVLGSIFLRQKEILEPEMWLEINHEALDLSAQSCRIVPAGLGEMVGDYAALSVGVKALEDQAASVPSC